MKIGILQCDDVMLSLQKNHGNYPDMFMRLLSRVDPDLSFEIWCCHDGQIPDANVKVDAWLITGSKYGVNDDLQWVDRLCDLIRQLYVLKKPVVGVCFGYQLIAHAMSGIVRRNPQGWGLGVSFNSVNTQLDWMEPWQPTLNLIVSHQDQVIRLPTDAVALASSSFCPYYLMQLGKTFLGVQGHPEFTSAYAADLMTHQRHYITDEQIEIGLASLSSPQDADVMAQWIVNFMRFAVLTS